MSKECIGYNDITKNFVYMSEEKILSLNARFDTKPEDMKVNIWGYELCNGAEWKDFLDVVNKLGKEKTDLETKLAESEERYKKAYREGLLQKQFDKDMEISQLKQQLAELKQDYDNLFNGYVEAKRQLAEKDAELEEVKQTRTQILNFGKRTKKVVIVNPYGEDCVVYNQEDQDKIEFTIEKLEKVKEEFDCIYSGDTYSPYQIADKIDNIINELKEGKYRWKKARLEHLKN